MPIDDPHEREIDRLRQAVAIAKLWFEQFASPEGFVWRGARTPHECAAEALDALRGVISPGSGDASSGEGAPEARGTGQIERLHRARSGFVEFNQDLARRALAIGQFGAARAALRSLRASDFVGETVEEHLAVLRNSQASADEVSEAARAIVSLRPRPASEALD